jgi:hypothetical protein
VSATTVTAEPSESVRDTYAEARDRAHRLLT